MYDNLPPAPGKTSVVWMTKASHERGVFSPKQPALTSSRHIPDRRAAALSPKAPAVAIRFPLNNFRHFLTLFSKFFSPFPHGTCSLSVSRQYLALEGIYLPIGAAFPNNPTLRKRLVECDSRAYGILTLSDVPFRGTLARPSTEDASIDYNSPTEGRRFSRWALPGSLAVTRGILVSFFSSAY